MSCAMKSQFKYPSNRENEKFYLDDDEDDDFDFQYVPVSQFKHIIRDVKRQRTRNEEEQVWNSFLREQEQSAINCQHKSSESKKKSTRTLAESLEECDKELMRLKADNLPESNINAERTESKTNLNSARSRRIDTSSMENDGGSNLLLTIPEEENAYCLTESSESCKPSKGFLRKSCSDQTFKIKRKDRSYHYNSNDIECHSSPDISPDRLSNEDDTISVHPDPVAVTKILGIQRKISTTLDSISYELDRIPLPDGENDLLRRQQRVVEFSTRLSRNYLYDLGRQISDIQRHLKAITPNGKIRLSRRGIILHMQAIETKLISAHQLLLTALTAYWKHVPSSVLKNHPGKLKEILQIVVQLKNICTEIKLTPDFYCAGDDRDIFLGKETENRCTAILSKFRAVSDNESQVLSHTARSSIITPSRSKKQKSRKSNRLLSNRLSMYTIDMRMAKTYQPKKSYSMFQISNRKQNSAIYKQQQNNSLAASKKSPSFAKASSEALGPKSTKICLPLKEDDIQTMMETIPSDLDGESLQSIKSGKKSETEKSRKNIIFEENTKESARLSKNKVDNDTNNTKNDLTKETCFSSLLPVIGDLISLVQSNKQNNPVSGNAFYEFLQKCQQNTDSSDTHCGYRTKSEIETGTKNMRLICYSAIQNEEKNQIIEINEHEEILKFSDVSCQANYLKNGKTCKLTVSPSITASLNDYRNQNTTYLKSNPMYTSSTQNKPWEIVSWIADKLIDELIVELSDDFQMEDVIQKLFDLEFQEI